MTPNGDLDLEHGIPEDPTSARRRRRREQRQGAEEAREKPVTTVSDSDLRGQLGRAFDGLVKGREARGDEELADALREEADAMVEGFVTLTNNVKALRMPLVVILNLVITLLAFGRVGGILLTRLAARREQRQAERAAAEGNTDQAFPIYDQQ